MICKPPVIGRGRLPHIYRIHLAVKKYPLPAPSIAPTGGVLMG